MRFKLTILLLLANLAVFFVLWRLDRPAPIVPQPRGMVDKDFTPDHIVIKDAQNEVREFQQGEDGNWDILQPYAWPANKFAIRPLYTNLQLGDIGASITPEELKQGSQTLKDFGLDKPMLEVTLADKSHSQTLYVGSATARGGNVYVMNKEKGDVLVVAQSVLAGLFAPLADLRDNTIFRTQPYEAQSLSIWSSQAQAPKLVKFVKDGDAWMLDTPLVRRADTAQVDALVKKLDGLLVGPFLSPAEADQARASLANPTLKIELQGVTSQTLDVGGDAPAAAGAGPEVYAQMEGSKIIFMLKKSDLTTEDLLNPQDTLRERQFLDFDPASVKSLAITSADGEVRLDRLETRWQVSDKDRPFDADADTVAQLLNRLHALTALNFASDAPGDLAPFGLAHPLGTVVLHTDKVLTLDLGRDTPEATKDSHYYAKLEGTGTDADTVYEIDRDIFDQLDSRPLHFRDHVLESLPAGAQITSLKLTQLPDEKEIFNYAPQDNLGWEDYLTKTLHDTAIVRHEPLLSLVNYMKKFVVQDYRAAAFTDDYQISISPTAPMVHVPWRYRLEAGVQIPAADAAAAQNRTLTFYFSDEFGGLQIGGATEPKPGAVFDLTPALVTDLSFLTLSAEVPPAVEEVRQPAGLINPEPGPPALVPASVPPAPAPVPPAPTTPPPAATPTPAPPAATPAPAEPAPAVPARTARAAPARPWGNLLIFNS